MTRISTWEADLSAYIAEVRTRPYAYGEHDCGLFAAGAVLAMTGVDHGAPFRGQYDSAIGAARALKRHGAGDLEATLDTLFAPCPAGFARRGDLVWSGEAVGVSMGRYALFVGRVETKDGAALADGLVRVPRAEWVKGWRVE